MSLILEGIKTIIIRSPRIPIGSRRSKKGGGGNGGRTSGRISREAVKHTSKTNDSTLK